MSRHGVIFYFYPIPFMTIWLSIPKLINLIMSAIKNSGSGIIWELPFSQGKSFYNLCNTFLIRLIFISITVIKLSSPVSEVSNQLKYCICCWIKGKARVERRSILRHIEFTNWNIGKETLTLEDTLSLRVDVTV